MLMVSPVNISIGVVPSFPYMREYISAYRTWKKSHMNFGALLRIILGLYLSLSIFIIHLDLFCQGENGSVVLTSIRKQRMHYCSSVCGPVFSPALSDTRVFGTQIYLVTTFKDSPACDLYCMGWKWTKPSPSVNIWSHVFHNIYFCFANNVSV